MEMQEVHDQKKWNGFLLDQPTQAGIFLQSWEWGEFQKSVGRKVYRFKSGETFAQVVELPLPYGKKYWFVPRGSLIDGFEEEARRCGVLFVRIEPPQKLHATRYKLHATRPISPSQTSVIDLTHSEEELLSAMHEKTRYNVRLGLRKGIEVREGNFEEFWKMLQDTARRDKFNTHPRDYYGRMLETMGTWEHGKRETMRVKLWMAYTGITPIAAAIVGYFGDTATYLHGASSYEHRALMGPYALHWQIMQEAKKRKYKYYDFWGTTARQHAVGIARFKMGFGGKIIDYPGTFDLPLNKLWYTVYRFGRKVL